MLIELQGHKTVPFVSLIIPMFLTDSLEPQIRWSQEAPGGEGGATWYGVWLAWWEGEE